MNDLSANFRCLSDHLPDLDWFPVADLPVRKNSANLSEYEVLNPYVRMLQCQIFLCVLLTKFLVLSG